MFNLKKRKIYEAKHVIKGMVHSFETFGAVDGPGLRIVIFLEGCHLRCAYCCNRDMLDLKDYMSMTPDQLLQKITPYREYFQSSGGVTISGGDPMYQPDFVREFLKLCKKEAIHTTLDTSLLVSREKLEGLIPYTDLFMVSLKHFDNDIHRELIQVPNTTILSNIRYVSSLRDTRLWFRYVILPGYTDTEENLSSLEEFLNEVNYEQIELLPYHTLGKHKWLKLGLKYSLEGVPEPTKKNIDSIYNRLVSKGVKAVIYEEVGKR